MKLLDYIGKKLGDLGLGNESLDTKPKAYSMKEKTPKMDLIQIKNLSSLKDTVKKLKRQAIE